MGTTGITFEITTYNAISNYKKTKYIWTQNRIISVEIMIGTNFNKVVSHKTLKLGINKTTANF